MRLRIPPTTKPSLSLCCTSLGSLRSGAAASRKTVLNSDAGLGYHQHQHQIVTLTTKSSRILSPDFHLSRPVFPDTTTTTTSTTSTATNTEPRRAMATATSASALSPAEQAALVDASKRAAAFQAVKEHMDFSYRLIGVGSGSTVVYVVEALRALGSEVTDKMSFFSTGDQSRELILSAGFRLQYIQDLPEGTMLDVAFDGADEVDEELNLIKGGGACLFQEKLVVTKAKKFVCVADFRKLSSRLGEQWKKGIPIEVVPNATGHVLSELRKLGSLNPQTRSGLPGKAGSIVTDNGNSLIDAPFPPLALAKDLKGEDGTNGIWTVDGLADKLIKIVGVVEAGLFCGANGYQAESGAQKPVAAYFGMADGSIEVRKA